MNGQLVAEILSIGDEILIGQITNTNAAYLGAELTRLGIRVDYISTCRDTEKAIVDALTLANNRASLIIVTGGLGPTRDDVTKNAICQFFNTSLEFNESVYDHLKHLFATYIKVPMNQNNRDQALLPKTCEVLFNEHGTAPGMWFAKDGADTVFLPGVPFEMKSLFENKVLPKLQLLEGRRVILNKTLLTYGIGESALAERIEDIENNLPQGFSLAYLPNFGRVRLRISANVSAAEEKTAQQEMDRIAEVLKERFSDAYSGEEADGGLEARIGKVASDKKLTIVAAESFTSGRIAGAITSIPGSSAYFLGSYVTYATDMKVNVLGVSESLIQKYSVVSAEVASAMAKAALEKSGADLAVATTGNAGPSKGDSTAPIGEVFIALATKAGVMANSFSMGTHRERVVQRSVNKALELIYTELLKL